MSKIIVNTQHIHVDEVDALKEELEADCWGFQELTTDEINGLISLINYVIGKRKSDKASDLSYTELLELKNKLQR
jgi:hypothetical protein